MTTNHQNPFDPFRIDPPWHENRRLRLNGFKRRIRRRGLVGAAISVALAVGTVGFGHVWLALP